MKLTITAKSGRQISVELKRTSPMHDREVRVVSECECASNPALPRSVRHSHGIDMSGIESGRYSLADTYWRKWLDMDYPADAANVKPPVGLVAGKKLTAGTEVWHAGVGAPAEALGAQGEWYMDLAAGQPYKRTRGLLRKLAETRADEYDTWLTGVEALEKLNLPVFVPEPEPLPAPHPDALKVAVEQRAQDIRREMLPELMAEAEERVAKKLYIKIRDQFIEDQVQAGKQETARQDFTESKTP